MIYYNNNYDNNDDHSYSEDDNIDKWKSQLIADEEKYLKGKATVLSQLKKQENNIPLLSVSESLRKNCGKVKVKGTIIGISKLFKMITKIEYYCDDCQKLIDLEFPLPVFFVEKMTMK